MLLDALLANVEVKDVLGPSPREVAISGLAYDSRLVEQGMLFAALPGTEADGHDYAEAAVRSGAAALLVQHPVTRAGEVTQVVVADARRALAVMAHHFHGDPSREMIVVGITGTNGKTTLSYLVESVLAASESAGPVGVIGTVEVRYGGSAAPASMTTPQSLELAELLANMRDAGVGQVVMEVSSHGLDQHRAGGISFDAAVFTNLTRDHLDYHPDMEHYFAAKTRLFTELLPASRHQGKHPQAVVCVDDSWGRKLVQRLEAAGMHPITYGLREGAQVVGRSDHLELDGTLCRVTFADESVGRGDMILRSALVGRHNLQNIAGAAAVGLSLGLSPEMIASGLEALPGVPGRLERVGADKYGPAVFVDYAHTDQALAGVLSTLRPLTPGRLICVFGAGGDRDRGKRPLMGRAVAEGADMAVLTSDNPRTEDPLAIMTMIEDGLVKAGAKPVTDPSVRFGPAYIKEPNRATAIALAVAGAGPEDVVLIAGKGHEDYQIVGTAKSHFDDREQAEAALAKTPRVVDGGQNA